MQPPPQILLVANDPVNNLAKEKEFGTSSDRAHSFRSAAFYAGSSRYAELNPSFNFYLFYIALSIALGTCKTEH